MSKSGWLNRARGLAVGVALGLGASLGAGLADAPPAALAQAQDDLTLKRGVGEITPEDREPSGPNPPVFAYLIAIGCLVAVVGVLCYPNRKDV